MDNIVISKCYITSDGNLSRLNTEIIEKGDKFLVWSEVENKYASYLCSELGDGIVYLCLPIAIREGLNIISELPISEVFLHNLNEILIPHLVRGDKRLKNISIEAPLSRLTFNGDAIGTAISGGIDSTYTLKQYLSSSYPYLSLTHLVITSESPDLWNRSLTNEDNLYKWETNHQVQFTRYKKIAHALGLPLIKIFTNYFNYLCMKKGIDRIFHFYVHNYLTMAAILSIKKIWRGYIFSSAFPYTEFTLKDNSEIDTAFYELLSMYILTIPGFLCINGGIKADRIEKTVELADYPLAQTSLHPCFTKAEKNCSLPTCNKCMRALFTLDAYDKLENMRDVFDIIRYKNNRIDYFVKLYQLRTSNWFKDLYTLLSDKYPSEFKKAIDIYNKEQSPVNRNFFNLISNNYGLSLKYLEIDHLHEKIKKFFDKKGLDYIFIIGESRLGLTIKEIMVKFVNITEIKDDAIIDVLPSDYVFILDLDPKFMNSNKEIVKSKGFHNIIDIYDLLKELK